MREEKTPLQSDYYDSCSRADHAKKVRPYALFSLRQLTATGFVNHLDMGQEKSGGLCDADGRNQSGQADLVMILFLPA